MQKIIKELKDNSANFDEIFFINDYVKEEDIIKKDNYEINVPRNIELISEVYLKDCMQNFNYEFEKVKIYIKKDIMLMVKKEINEKIFIFICNLINHNEEIDFNYEIQIEGIIISDKPEDEVKTKIIDPILVCRNMDQYLINGKINKEKDEIQTIEYMGEKVGKYLKYIKSNIKDKSNINDNNKKDIDIPKKDNDYDNPFYINENNNNITNNNKDNFNNNTIRNLISENQIEYNEEDEKQEEEEEEEEESDGEEFLELYWKSVPDFYLNEVIEQINNKDKKINDKNNIDNKNNVNILSIFEQFKEENLPDMQQQNFSSKHIDEMMNDLKIDNQSLNLQNNYSENLVNKNRNINNYDENINNNIYKKNSQYNLNNNFQNNQNNYFGYNKNNNNNLFDNLSYKGNYNLNNNMNNINNNIFNININNNFYDNINNNMNNTQKIIFNDDLIKGQNNSNFINYSNNNQNNYMSKSQKEINIGNMKNKNLNNNFNFGFEKNFVSGPINYIP